MFRSDLPDGLHDEGERGCLGTILRYGHGVDGKVEDRRDAHLMECEHGIVRTDGRVTFRVFQALQVH